MSNEPIGQTYTDADEWLKIAVYGEEGTGKTTFGVEFARLRPKAPVFYINLEPKANLISILRKYPDVWARTQVIPTDEEKEQMVLKAMQLGPSTQLTSYDAVLSEFIIDKVIDLFYKRRSELIGSVIVVDTASQVYRKLMQRITELRETDEKVMRMAQLAYSKPKYQFAAMIKYLADLDADVIWLGRTRPAGEEVPDPKTGKPRYKVIKGQEDPEWKDSLNYEATVIIHLTKKEEYLYDENNSYIYGNDGKPIKVLNRYAKIVKHKADRAEVPVIKDPTPAKVIAWLRGMDLNPNTKGLVSSQSSNQEGRQTSQSVP